MNHPDYVKELDINNPFEYKEIVFDKYRQPIVSIIIPVCNKWKFTYSCLQSIKKNTKGLSYEIIIIDDNSSDRTKDMRKIIKNVKFIRNTKNKGFLKNCNGASKYSSGKYLLFLNNDTIVLKDSILSLLNTIKNKKSVGAVGGKIILPNNTLQEAGCIIWKDASTSGYGVGKNPRLPEYNFVREVDYCSGAFFMTKKELFFKLGKFDVRYSPAYYEEVDYCMRLRKKNYRILYQPLAEIIHFQSTSYEYDVSKKLVQKNKLKFFNKWHKKLSEHNSFDENNL